MNNNMIIKLTIISFLFSSCFAISPELDGRRAAKQFCDYNKAVLEYRKKNVAKLINNFDAYHFKTRLEVRGKLQEIYDKAFETNNTRLLKAQQKYRVTLGKYATNYIKNAEFEYAYQGYLKTHTPDESTLETLKIQIERLILFIIPPVPDKEKIKRDLSGHEVRENPKIYFDEKKRFLIEEDKISYIEIKNMRKEDDACLFDIDLIFQSGNSEYLTNIDVMYVLQQYDDWTIEYVGSGYLKIVKTGKYDQYIDIWQVGGKGYPRFEFVNNADIPLLVGGAYLSGITNKWSIFLVLVNGYSTSKRVGAFIGDSYYGDSAIECRIDFVERP